MNEEPKQKFDDATLLDNLLSIEARKPGRAASLPAAIRIIEPLEPAGGKDIPVFPASYAGVNDQSPPVYDLAGIEYGEGEDVVRIKNSTTRIPRIKNAKLCAIDSPQSQANRMEPAFLEAEDLRELVPQAIATIPKRENGSESVLTLPHRVADFRIRLSDKAATVKNAIASFAKGDALPLIQAFPTSLLFGFWDSRGDEDVGVKHARILLSRIDAHDVVPCRRHSQYTGPYSEDEFREVVLDHSDKHEKLSKYGFTGAPSDGLGGVLVNGKIERISVLSLSDIARINCYQETKIDETKTNAARRYLFALSALAEGHERSKGSHRLRSGCELVADGGPKIEFRGTKPTNAEELKMLYNDRARLIAVAKEALKILDIKLEKKTYTVTASILKITTLKNKDEIQKIRTNIGNLKLEWENADAAVKKAEKAQKKAEQSANEAEKKASDPNSTEKVKKAAKDKIKKAEKAKEATEDKRKKADDAKTKYEEAKEEAGDLIQEDITPEHNSTQESGFIQ